MFFAKQNTPSLPFQPLCYLLEAPLQSAGLKPAKPVICEPRGFGATLTHQVQQRPHGAKARKCLKAQLCTYIYIYIYIWVNYNSSLTWIKAILGWSPLLTMISSEVAVRSLEFPQIYVHSVHSIHVLWLLQFEVWHGKICESGEYCGNWTWSPSNFCGEAENAGKYHQEE